MAGTAPKAKSSGHPVLLANDAYAAWKREGEALAERREVLVGQVMEARQEREQALQEHEQAVRIAVEAGAPIPKPPKEPDGSHLDAAMSIQNNAERTHRERRTAVLAEAGQTGVLDALDERERLRMGRLRPVVEALLAELREAAADAQAYRDVVQAVDLMAGETIHPSRAERIETQPGPAEVIEAVREERSLLEPRPLSAVMPQGGLGLTRVETVRPGDEATRIPPLPGKGGFGNSDTWPRVNGRHGRGRSL